MTIHRSGLPQPLRGNEQGTFTEYSVTERLPDIAGRVIQENELSRAAVAAVEALAREINEGVITPLTVPGPNRANWDGYVSPHVGRRWVDVPWFFAEYYFYRRVLDAIGYWDTGTDPYRVQKRLGLDQALAPAAQTIRAVDSAYARGVSTDILLIELTDAALWGNQVDLSLWPADAGAERESDRQEDRLLVDDRPLVIDLLKDRVPPPVAIVLDNAGAELVADLFVADLLLRSDLVSRVVLHAKRYPIFVSDATHRDVVESIGRLAGESDPHMRSAGERLHVEHDAGRIVIDTDPYWVSPLGWRSRPAELEESLAETGLIVVKGDANYRRLLDDRHWEFTTPFPEAIGSTPSPLLSLRTIKSETAAGLRARDVAAAGEADPRWLQNGRWAMASYSPAVARVSGD